jgi:hypothetical protein
MRYVMGYLSEIFPSYSISTSLVGKFQIPWLFLNTGNDFSMVFSKVFVLVNILEYVPPNILVIGGRVFMRRKIPMDTSIVFSVCTIESDYLELRSRALLLVDNGNVVLSSYLTYQQIYRVTLHDGCH